MIRDKLISLSEPSYKLFSEKLIPNTNNILGVRLPVLKKLAKEIALTNCIDYINSDEIYFEEVMLKGFIINSLKISKEDRLVLINKHIYKLSNWSLCDSFCSSLKFKDNELDYYFNYLNTLLNSKKPYVLRFVIVTILTNYTKEEYLTRCFKILNEIKHDDYYVKMAVAWTIQGFFVKFKEQTYSYLNNNDLDTFTYNKSLQKITESNKVKIEDKDIIKKMKKNKT